MNNFTPSTRMAPPETFRAKKHMEIRSIFINYAGRLRSGWRVLIFVVLCVAVWFFLGTIVRVLFALLFNFAPAWQPGLHVADAVYRLSLLTAALVAGYLCARFLEGLPWRALGLALHPGWYRDLLVGSLIGIASLALATAIATAGGGLRFAGPEPGLILQVTQTLVFSAAIFLLAALTEEALFRGYPLQTLTRAGWAWFAVLLTSVPFAAAHLNNPNVAQPFTFINTALAGVWLAAAYLRTRSLWFPLGVHWAWNWALGSLFGLPVSGITELAPHPLFRGADLGPVWLTGGSYGIEGGLACTVALVVSTIFICRTRLVTASEEMRALTSGENPVIPGVSRTVVPLVTLRNPRSTTPVQNQRALEAAKNQRID